MRERAFAAGTFLIFCTVLASGQEARVRRTGLVEPLPSPAPLRSDLPLGFVVHPHERYFDAYASNSASSMLANLFCWRMRDDQQMLIDFGPPEHFLRTLYASGQTAIIIVDTSIHHGSVPFRSRLTGARGENIVDAQGNTTEYPSPWSTRYREMVDQYVEDLVLWVRDHDPAGRIIGYTDGAEVFYPGILDCSPLAETEFRRWLAERYGSLDAINRRWETAYSSYDEIGAVRFYRLGHGRRGPSTFGWGSTPDCGWVARVEPITPNAPYRLTVWAKATDVPVDLAGVVLVWHGGDGRTRHDAGGSLGGTTPDWLPVEAASVAPAWATAVTVVLGLQGPGTLSYCAPVFSRSNTRGNLLPATASPDGATPAHWHAAAWRGQPTFSVRHGLGRGGSTALVLHGEQTPAPYGRPAAAWHDFVTFQIEGYARVMDDWAVRIRQRDPDRKVIHYLGFLLGTLCQWDDLTMTNRPDIPLRLAASVDVNGLQLPAARGDFHYATAILDLARKYDKPMWATDLQDFTHGTYIGYSALNRTTLACIAHGLDGVYYYCWYGTPDYDFHRHVPAQEIRRLLENAAWAVRFLEAAALDTRVAFVIPLLPYSLADPGGIKADPLDCAGWYKIITQAGMCPDVFTPYELEHEGSAALSNYRLVVVPDCPNLPISAAAALRDFAARGGTLLLGGRPPHLDETNRPLDEPFLPTGATSVVLRGEPLRVLPVDQAGLAAGTVLAGSATLLDARGQWTGLRRISWERGTVWWTGGLDGRGYLGPVVRMNVAGNTPPLFVPDGPWTWPRDEGLPLLELFRTLAGQCDALPPAVLDPPNPAVQVVCHRTSDALLVCLVHTGPGETWGNRLVAGGSWIGNVQVWADSEVIELDRPPEVADGRTQVLLPDFGDACLVRLSGVH